MMLLNPSFVFDTLRLLFRSIPPWPKDTAVSLACRYDGGQQRCRLALPMTAVDYLGALFVGKPPN